MKDPFINWFGPELTVIVDCTPHQWSWEARSLIARSIGVEPTVLQPKRPMECANVFALNLGSERFVGPDNNSEPARLIQALLRQPAWAARMVWLDGIACDTDALGWNVIGEMLLRLSMQHRLVVVTRTSALLDKIAAIDRTLLLFWDEQRQQPFVCQCANECARVPALAEDIAVRGIGAALSDMTAFFMTWPLERP